jgi:hypothetical protein
MRWQILLCSCFFLIVCTLPALADEPTVTITGFDVTPAVLMPGDRGLITVTLTTTAQSATETESSTFGTIPSSTITTTRDINPVIESVFLSGGEIRVVAGNSQFEGELGPGQSVNLTFLIEAPQKNGIFFPVLRVRVKGAASLIYPIPVNVNMPVALLRTPALVVEQPPIASIRPGEQIDLSMTLTNVGESAADDIAIRIIDEDPSIAPSKGGFFHINHLEAGETRSIEVSLYSDKSAPSGIHELPLSLQYTLVDGSQAHQTESIGVNIRGQSELVIRSVTTDPVRVGEGDQFDLIIRLENTGTGEARSIQAGIDLPLQGIKDAYIGTIQAGNDAPAVFVLTANQSGDFSYRFHVAYQDDWGVLTEEHTLHLTVSRSAGPVITLLVFIVLVVSGGVAWYYYRKRGAS